MNTGTLFKKEDKWMVRYWGIDPYVHSMPNQIHQTVLESPLDENSNWFINEHLGKEGMYKEGDTIVFELERYCPTHKCSPVTGPCTLDCGYDETTIAKIK